MKNTWKIFKSKNGEEIKVLYHAYHAEVVRIGKETKIFTFNQLDEFLKNI